MTTQGLTEDELSILLGKGTAAALPGSPNDIPFMPRSKKKRKSYHIFMRLLRLWRH